MPLQTVHQYPELGSISRLLLTRSDGTGRLGLFHSRVHALQPSQTQCQLSAQQLKPRVPLKYLFTLAAWYKADVLSKGSYLRFCRTDSLSLEMAYRYGYRAELTNAYIL